MKREEFWSLIDATRSDDDPYNHLEAIESTLSLRPVADIVDFQRHVAELLASSYTWNLWGAAYLINGGCSDDGFDYFRGWLITQGESVFDSAVANPDSLAALPSLQEDVECEGLLYVARTAYQAVTGDKITELPINLPDLGEGRDFDDDEEMKQRYPKLFAKFCDD